jgi:hypothetical protein
VLFCSARGDFSRQVEGWLVEPSACGCYDWMMFSDSGQGPVERRVQVAKHSQPPGLECVARLAQVEAPRVATLNGAPRG